MRQQLHTLRSAISRLTGSKITTETHSKSSGDTAEGCRERAAADLQAAGTAADPHERRQFREGAERWLLRAAMLDRLVKSFRKRAALDEASRRYRREKV